MLDASREARITEAGERFMAGELSAGELLGRAASALWDQGEDGIRAMATEYRALPGGDGGEWAGPLADAPTILANRPVAQNGAAPMRMPVVTKEIELGGDYAGWKLTIRRNAPLDVVLRLDGLKTDSGDLGGLIDMLPEIIVRWNFVDEQGDPLPLTAAGARHLPLDLFRAVMEAFGEVIADSAAVPPK